MADWTALAGMSGFAAALDEIQNRRVKEAELQRQLTKDQGEWLPATGGGGGIGGFFDALLGYNKPGQIGFGSQRYRFEPYAPVTEDQARAWGMTYPEETQVPGLDMPSRNIAAPGSQPTFGAPAAALARKTPDMAFTAADTNAYPFTTMPGPTRTITEEKPMPGIVGMRLGPKEKMALFQEQLKERRELAKLEREQAVLKDFNLGGFRVGTGTTGTTPLPPETSPVSGGPAGTAAPAPATGTPAAAVSGAIPGTDKTTPQFMAKAQKISNDLGMRLDDFLRVMSYETNGSFSPSQKNIGNKSSATGLIQFLSKTAKNLGTTTEALAAMSPEQQLDYVAKYLAPYKGKIGTLQDLYMAVLSPASIGKPGTATVFSKDTTPAEYEANSALDVDKKGYITVSDATNALLRRTGSAQQPAQVPAQAQTPGQPDTSMLVAGNAAPAPPGAAAPQPAPGTAAAPAPDQGTPVGTPAPPQAPFALSLEGRRQILANNKTIERNNQEIQALDQKQRTANYLAATRKNPQLGAMAVQIGQRIADLSRDNQSLRDMSEKTLQDEAREWRLKGEKLEERRRRPQELAAEKTAERTAEEGYYDTRPVGEHPRLKSEEYFVRATGDPIDDSMLTREMRARNAAGQLTRLADTEQRKQLTTLKMLEPLLKQYAGLVQYAYGTDTETGKPGPLAQFSRTPSATASAMIAQAAQNDPVLQAKRRALEGQLQTVVRALGSRGDLNEGELAAAKGLIANMDASMGLGLNIGVGLGTTGVGPMLGVKPSFSVPDTPAVGLKLANELVDLVNSRIGSLLRNKDYQGTPAITLPGTPAAGSAPSAPVATRLQAMTPDQIRQAPAAALAPLKNTQGLERQGFSPAQADAIRGRVIGRTEAALGPTMGQTTPLNPQWSRNRIPQMTPAEIRNAPPEVIADVNRVSDIPGLTPEQHKALAARLRQRNEAAVKMRRAS